MRVKFNAAAGSSNNQLTAKQANDAGWGFITDHFAEIDRDRDGYVNFSEVEGYLDARSPIKIKRKAAVQNIE